MPHSCTCADADAAVVRSVARILDRLGHDIELLAVELSGDTEVALRHSQLLQSIDHIAQQQHCLADILRADAPALAIGHMPLADLADELRHALD
jgi:ubiquinone biosynthesis protein UbiJ